MTRVTSQCLEQFGWSACGSPRLNKEIGKKSKKQGRAEERVRKVRLKAVSQVSHLFQISTHLSSTWSFVDFHRINKSGLSIVFQSAPMVLNSHRERDNFQVHLCCKFTPNFANAGSMEIKIIRNRCWVYWQPKRRRRIRFLPVWATKMARGSRSIWSCTLLDERQRRKQRETPESASLALDCAATEDPLWSPPQSVETAIVSEDCRMPITNIS